MRRLLPLLLAAPLLLVGCTSSSDAGPELPAESAFAEGTCRTAAPDVRAVGGTLSRLDGDEVPAEVRDELREAQDRLFALAEAAEPTYKPALDVLVVKIGAVRIRADGNSYDEALGDELRTAYDEVVEVCTS